MRAWALVGVVTLLIAGCGGTAGEGTLGSSPVTAVATSTTEDSEGDTTVTTQAPAATTTLAKVSTTDTPPTTAADVTTTTEASLPTGFSAWVGGGDPWFDCWSWRDRAGDPGSYVGLPFAFESTTVGGWTSEICVVEPPPAGAYSLVIEGPDGSTSHELVITTEYSFDLLAEDLLSSDAPVELIEFEPSWYASHPFTLEPWLTVGPYAIALFADGVLAIDGRFELEEVAEPYVQTVTGGERAGDTATVLLTGFAPNQEIPLGLYALTDDQDPETDLPVFTLVAPLGTFAVNDGGWSYVDITIPADLLPGPSSRDPTHHCIASPGLHALDCSQNQSTQILYITDFGSD